MKRHSFKIWLSLLAVCVLFLVVNIMAGKAQGNGATAPIDLCAPSYKLPSGDTITPKYNDPALSLEDRMNLYHKTINEKFNSYIAEMIPAENEAAATNVPDSRGQPPLPRSDTDPTLQDCQSDNYSTYCVAMTLLNDPTWGYLAYTRALDCKKNSIFKSKTDQDLWNKWINTTTCLGGVESIVPPKICTPADEAQLEKEITDRYQGQKALQISAQMEAVTREKDSAKRALDQTLSAYDQLRVAWPMHKKYIEIYKQLTTYRDKLVEIRNQVEEFPNKFIDASTTKCT